MHSKTLERGLATLLRAGASVELRTVVLQQNWNDLPALAEFISTRLNFISFWAVMQLERIGYGRMNWTSSFKDTSVDFDPLARALDIVTVRGTQAWLYNFPACSVRNPTVPMLHQRFQTGNESISIFAIIAALAKLVVVFSMV